MKNICEFEGCEKTTTCRYCIHHKPRNIPCAYVRDGQRCGTESMQEFCAKHRTKTIEKRRDYYKKVIKVNREADVNRVLKKRGRPAKIVNNAEQ